MAIRANRVAKEFSQESFAAAVGLHRTYIGSIERGERNVSLQNLVAVANGLNMSLSQLLADAEARLKSQK